MKQSSQHDGPCETEVVISLLIVAYTVKIYPSKYSYNKNQGLFVSISRYKYVSVSSNRTSSLIQNIILIAIDKPSSSLSSSSGLRKPNNIAFIW